MFNFHPISVACLFCLIFSGCAKTTTPQINSRVADEASVKSATLQGLVKQSEEARIAAQEVDQPYLVGNSIPLSREATMPPGLRTALITANFQRDPMNLETALRKLSEASGLLITATPDALLPASMFLPRGAVTGVGDVQGAGNAPPAVPLMGGASPSIVLASAAPPAGQGPLVILRGGERGESRALWAILDEIARQANLSWRPVAAGGEFYRLETKVFHLPAVPPTFGTSASLARNGASNSAFETVNKTTLTLKDQDAVKGAAQTVEALLTTGGRVVVSAESQTIIVTDTSESISRISRFIENLHRNLTRRVRVVVDAYEVTNRDNNDLGFNWDLLYTSVNRTLMLRSPTPLAGTQSGMLGAKQNTGAMAGSSLVVNAINEVASVVNQRSFPFTVTSGKPYTVAMRKTFDYVNQVQVPSQTSTGSIITTVTTPPSVMQKEETVGTFLTVIPTAKADGTIYIALYIDQTSNRPLNPFTVGGNGSDGITVQQKTIDGTGFILEAPARSGVPLVMGGIEFDTGTLTERRLAQGAPLLLGGANQRDSQKTRTVLVVTAISEEGV